MRLYNSTTSTENRFYVRTDLKEFQKIELTAVYPDVPPKLSNFNDIFEKSRIQKSGIPYPVNIHIYDSSGLFRPYVNLIGEQSDSGFRAYPGKLTFLEKNQKDEATVNFRNTSSSTHIETEIEVVLAKNIFSFQGVFPSYKKYRNFVL